MIDNINLFLSFIDMKKKLRMLSERWWHCILSLFFTVQIIIVHKNPVAAIHSAAFQCLTHLTTLSINSPLLRMAPSLIRQSLTILVLAHSKVKSGPDYFNGAHKQALWLQHCDLTAIPASIDSLVSSLRLDLSDNYVTTLKPLHGVQFDKLSTLSLHRNRIVHIDSERLFLPPLCVVYLQHNLLTTLSEPKKSGALTAFLEGNPWHCNASLGWLLRVFIPAGLARCNITTRRAMFYYVTSTDGPAQLVLSTKGAQWLKCCQS